MVLPSLRRRQVLQLGALAGLGLLGGCRRQDPQLLASRGDLSTAWGAALPRPWSLRLLDDPAAVVAALRPKPGQPADPRAALLQLSDGWATALPASLLQPIGSAALQDRLTSWSAPLSRLFAPPGSPRLAFPWSFSPWVLLLRNRPDLARRRAEGWDLLLDPSLAGQLVLPSSPRVTIALVDGDAERLARLRRSALAYDDRDALNLLLASDAQAAVLPLQRVIPLLRRDPRLAAILPASGSPLSWSLLLRPAGSDQVPPLEWLAEVLQPPLLPKLLAAGWVPPLPPATLQQAARAFPPPLAELLAPPAELLARCHSLPPLVPGERQALQALWDGAAPQGMAAAGR